MTWWPDVHLYALRFDGMVSERCSCLIPGGGSTACTHRWNTAAGLGPRACEGGDVEVEDLQRCFMSKLRGSKNPNGGFYIKHKLFLIFFDDLEFREFLRIWADPQTSCQWISNDAFHLCYPGKVLHDWKRGISHSCHFGYKMAHAHELNRLSVAFLSDKSYPKCAQQYNWWWQ